MPTHTAASPRSPALPAGAPAHGRVGAWPWIALAVGTAVLLPALGTMPGLHGDEAWAGWRAHRIARDGLRPLYGMNFYTGPLQQYLLAAVFEVFGYTVAALRAPTVAASLMSVLLYFAICRRLYGARVAAIAALLLVSFPFFALYGRMATENFVINPPAALGAVWCLLHATHDTHAASTVRRKLLLGAAAGLLLAIGTWTHTIFLPVVIVLALAAVARHGLALLRSRTLWGVVVGFGVGLAPRLYQMLASVPVAREFGLGTQASGSGEILAEIWTYLGLRAREWPGIYAAVLHGDLLFRRYTGELSWATFPFNPALLLAALLWLMASAARARGPERRQLAALLLALPLVIGLTLVITTHNSDRYFLLPLYLAPVLIALAIERSLLIRARTLRMGGVALIALVVLVNLARTGVNFFATFAQTGGRNAEITIGSELESSNHFVRSDQLYHELVQLGVRHVLAEFFVGAPLAFYDLAAHRFESVTLVEDLRADDLIPRGVTIVAYGGGRRRLVPEELPPPLKPARVLYQDEHFVVMK